MEIWDLYDRDGNRTGETWERLTGSYKKIPDGRYHMVCDILVLHKDGTYLLTKRHMDKEVYPGYWEASAGGSALAGEDPLECAKRELFEETGIRTDDFTLISHTFRETSHSMFYSYLAVTDCDKDSIVLQEGETVEYKWVDAKGLLEYVDSDKAIKTHNDRNREYIDRIREKVRSEEGTEIREINVNEITAAIREMCIEANLRLAPDMKDALQKASRTETGELGKKILGQLEENLKIADTDEIPICQDTGMAVVFLKIGQDVHFIGGSLKDAVNEGVRQGYTDGYLRKSVVSDPLLRENTDDNTPAIIHTEITTGDKVEITVAPKGFGSENMSRIFMLKPADGIEGVKNAVITAVSEAGANACPPMVVGVGIGADFEKCAVLAKKALTNDLNSVHSYYERQECSESSVCKQDDHESMNKTNAEFAATSGAKNGRKQPDVSYLKELQKDLFESLNNLDIGPGGMGGKNTVLGVNIETYPTHIAGMPVAVNICCHVNRHKSCILVSRE